MRVALRLQPRRNSARRASPNLDASPTLRARWPPSRMAMQNSMDARWQRCMLVHISAPLRLPIVSNAPRRCASVFSCGANPDAANLPPSSTLGPLVQGVRPAHRSLPAAATHPHGRKSPLSAPEMMSATRGSGEAAAAPSFVDADIRAAQRVGGEVSPASSRSPPAPAPHAQASAASSSGASSRRPVAASRSDSPPP